MSYKPLMFHHSQQHSQQPQKHQCQKHIETNLLPIPILGEQPLQLARILSKLGHVPLHLLVCLLQQIPLLIDERLRVLCLQFELVQPIADQFYHVIYLLVVLVELGKETFLLFV